MTTLIKELKLGDNHGLAQLSTMNHNAIYAIYDTKKSTLASIVQTFNDNYELERGKVPYEFVVSGIDMPVTELDMSKTPAELGLDTMLHMSVRFVTEKIEIKQTDDYKSIMEQIEKSSDKMYVTVATLTGGRYPIEVEPNMTGDQLFTWVEHKLKVPRDQQRLIFGGKQLEHEKTLKSYDIINGAVLHMVLRLRGGMYHETSGKLGGYKQLQDCVIYVDVTEHEIMKLTYG